jgi:ABC transport system ATP-binding/permease protein
MSERILRALMQMFAIIAKVDGVNNTGRLIVQSFLKQQLNLEQVETYLKIFDEFLETHLNASKRKEGAAKRTSLNSVKVSKNLHPDQPGARATPKSDRADSFAGIHSFQR